MLIWADLSRFAPVWFDLTRFASDFSRFGAI